MRCLSLQEEKLSPGADPILAVSLEGPEQASSELGSASPLLLENLHTDSSPKGFDQVQGTVLGILF